MPHPRREGDDGSADDDSDFSDVGAAAPRTAIRAVSVLYLGDNADGALAAAGESAARWFSEGLLAAFGVEGLDLVRNDLWRALPLGRVTTITVSGDADGADGEVLTLVAPTDGGRTGALLEIDVLLDSEPERPQQYRLEDGTPVVLMWSLGPGGTPDMAEEERRFWARNEALGAAATSDSRSRSEQAPAKPEQPPAKPEQPPAKPEQPPTKPEQPPAKPEQPPAKPEQPPSRPEQPPAKPEQPPAKPEQPPAKPEQPPAKPAHPRSSGATSANAPAITAEAPAGSMRVTATLISVQNIDVAGTIAPSVYAHVFFSSDAPTSKEAQQLETPTPDCVTPVAARNTSPHWHHRCAARFLVLPGCAEEAGRHANVVPVRSTADALRVRIVVFEKRLMGDNVLAQGDGIVGGLKPLWDAGSAASKIVMIPLAAKTNRSNTNTTTARLHLTLAPPPSSANGTPGPPPDPEQQFAALALMPIARGLPGDQKHSRHPAAGGDGSNGDEWVLETQVIRADLNSAIATAGSYFVRLVDPSAGDAVRTITQVVFSGCAKPCWFQHELLPHRTVAQLLRVELCRSVGTDRQQIVVGVAELSCVAEPASSHGALNWEAAALRLRPVASASSEPKFEWVGAVHVRWRCLRRSALRQEAERTAAEYRTLLPRTDPQDGDLELMAVATCTVVGARDLVEKSTTGAVLSDLAVVAEYGGDRRIEGPVVRRAELGQLPHLLQESFTLTHARQQVALTCICPAHRACFMGRGVVDVRVPSDLVSSWEVGATALQVDLGTCDVPLQPRDATDTEAELRAQDVAALNKLGLQNFGILSVSTMLQLLRVPRGGNVLRVAQLRLISAFVPRRARSEPPEVDRSRVEDGGAPDAQDLELGCMFALKRSPTPARPEERQGVRESGGAHLLLQPSIIGDACCVPADWNGVAPPLLPCAALAAENPLRVFVRRRGAATRLSAWSMLAVEHLTTQVAHGRLVLRAAPALGAAGSGGTGAGDGMPTFEVELRLEWLRPVTEPSPSHSSSLSPPSQHLWSLRLVLRPHGLDTLGGAPVRVSIAPAVSRNHGASSTTTSGEDDDDDDDDKTSDGAAAVSRMLRSVDTAQLLDIALDEATSELTAFGLATDSRTTLWLEVSGSGHNRGNGRRRRFAVLEMDALVGCGVWPTAATSSALGLHSGLDEVVHVAWAHGNVGRSEKEELQRRKSEESHWRQRQHDPGVPVPLQIRFVSQTAGAAEFEPTPVLGATLTKVRGRCYLYGGVNEVGALEPAVHRFTVRGAKWETLEIAQPADAPGEILPARHGHSTAVVGATLVIYGGVGFGGFDPNEVADDGPRQREPHRLGYLGDAWALDTESLALRRITTTPCHAARCEARRWRHSAVGWDNAMFVFGGLTVKVQVLQLQHSRERTYTALEELCETLAILRCPALMPDGSLDPPEFRWENVHVASGMRGAARPAPRAGHCAHPHGDGRMILFGGRTAAGCSNEIFDLDLRTLEWREVLPLGAVLPPPMELAASCVTPLGGSPCLVVAGGRYYDASTRTDTVMHLFMFCIETLFWRQIDFVQCAAGPMRIGAVLADVTLRRPQQQQQQQQWQQQQQQVHGFTDEMTVPQPGCRLRAEAVPVCRWLLIGGARRRSISDSLLFDGGGAAAHASAANVVFCASEDTRGRPVQLGVGAQLARARPQSAGGTGGGATAMADARLRLRHLRRTPAEIEAAATKLHRFKSYSESGRPGSDRGARSGVVVGASKKKYKSEAEQQSGVERLHDDVLRRRERERAERERQMKTDAAAKKGSVSDWDSHFRRVYYDAARQRQQARDFEFVMAQRGAVQDERAATSTRRLDTHDALAAANDQLYYSAVAARRKRAEKLEASLLQSAERPRLLSTAVLQRSVDRLSGAPLRPLSSGVYVDNIRPHRPASASARREK